MKCTFLATAMEEAILGCRWMQNIMQSLHSTYVELCNADLHGKVSVKSIEQTGDSSWFTIYFGVLDAFLLPCTISRSIHHLLVPSIALT